MREEACPRDTDLVTVGICPLGESRTHTPARAAHFECAASACSATRGYSLGVRVGLLPVSPLEGLFVQRFQYRVFSRACQL